MRTAKAPGGNTAFAPFGPSTVPPAGPITAPCGKGGGGDEPSQSPPPPPHAPSTPIAESVPAHPAMELTFMTNSVARPMINRGALFLEADVADEDLQSAEAKTFDLSLGRMQRDRAHVPIAARGRS